MSHNYLSLILHNYPYIIAFIVLFTGLFTILYSNNLIKKVVGLNIFQSAIIIFYIAASRINNGAAPIVRHPNMNILYTNPLPHVLMLTAIVVGIALTSVAFAIIIRIHQDFNTTFETEINKQLINKNEQ
ncbi:cation:proton antiporter subunit C [Rickettsiales bacterium LUAb2]